MKEKGLLVSPKPVIGPRTDPSVQVSDDKYSAMLATEPYGLVVTFKGTISSTNPALVLNPFIDAVHRVTSAAGVKHLNIDLWDLEFCNSSGFKCFIYWVQLILNTGQSQRYRLRFHVNPQRRWQKTSLLALTCFAVDLTEIVDA